VARSAPARLPRSTPDRATPRTTIAALTSQRQSAQPGGFYEYPSDPLVSGIGTPVSHTEPE
jgi:hypothetical protein